MKKQFKTNAMRILDELEIPYEHVDYNLDGKFKSAMDIAKKTDEDPEIVYKTIATISKDKDIYILVINADDNIDFKKAAAHLKEKSLRILPLKDLRKNVGYERGATTPLAMKKDFPVLIDQKARNHSSIKVSAGKVGHSIWIKPCDLIKATKGEYADICQ